MNNWQPIETAPKDGTQILCFEASGTMFVGMFEKWRDSESGKWRIMRGKEIMFGGDDYEPVELNPEPIRWMPLPEVPAPTGELLK